MIKSIKHKGLKQFFETGSTKGVKAEHAKRLTARLTVLNAATSLDDIALASWNLHPLSGELQGHYAINISGNWRLFFTFEDGDVYLLDYGDYH